MTLLRNCLAQVRGVTFDDKGQTRSSEPPVTSFEIVPNDQSLCECSGAALKMSPLPGSKSSAESFQSDCSTESVQNLPQSEVSKLP